jgi:AcrR family transcriptional regulator
MKRLRLEANIRQEMLLEAAVRFVRENGFEHMTCRTLATYAGCCYNTVQRQFSNRSLLGKAVTEYARKTKAKDVLKVGTRLGF